MDISIAVKVKVRGVIYEIAASDGVAMGTERNPAQVAQAVIEAIKALEAK